VPSALSGLIKVAIGGNEGLFVALGDSRDAEDVLV
jgi:hypothetical protein